MRIQMLVMMHIGCGQQWYTICEKMRSQNKSPIGTKKVVRVLVLIAVNIYELSFGTSVTRSLLNTISHHFYGLGFRGQDYQRTHHVMHSVQYVYTTIGINLQLA